jgi:hypothetical protein
VGIFRGPTQEELSCPTGSAAPVDSGLHFISFTNFFILITKLLNTKTPYLII